MIYAQRRLSPAVWVEPQAQQWWNVVVPQMTHRRFVSNFRVSRASFGYICRRLGPILERSDTNYRLSIPVEKRVAISLYKLASNLCYRLVAEQFGVGITTACHCLQDFCKAVIKVLLPDHIKTPDARKLAEMATFFNNRWRAPQCVGAIDGTHIPIVAPLQFPRDYHNRKSFHSIILQAVVDGKGLFWDVCVGYPGSVHDARVLKQSQFWDMVGDGQFFQQNIATVSGHHIGQYVIGDPAYPIQTWLVKPFADSGRLTPQQLCYNTRLSSARAIVESTFGHLKGRWRCLLKRNDCDLELVKEMALACCVLHNICEEHGDPYIEQHPRVDDPTPALQQHLAMEPAILELPEVEQDVSAVRAALLAHFNSV